VVELVDTGDLKSPGLKSRTGSSPVSGKEDSVIMNISVFITHPVVDCWNFKDKQIKALTEALPDANVEMCDSRDKFVRSLGDANIALIWGFNQEWFELSPHLEWIVTPAAGKDYFNVTPPKSVTIDYCGFHGELIGETVIGMILSHIRGIRDTIELGSSNPWPRDLVQRNMRPLRGAHVTILGFGNIGTWIGRLAKPFGVRITGVRRNPGARPDYFDAEDHIIAIDSLDSALPETDHLVLALPGDSGTLDIIDKRRIGLLPNHAAIYNIGRGNAIDEHALADALRTDRIAGAYLDVFKTEPLPDDSALRSCPNTVLMPHASAIAPNYLDLFVSEFIEKFRKRYS
jgi:phosphoglycerate dehydrogenase-like enzyme